jgi:hypothetical protein
MDNITDIATYLNTPRWNLAACQGAPGYPLTVTVGLTFRFRSK